MEEGLELSLCVVRPRFADTPTTSNRMLQLYQAIVHSLLIIVAGIWESVTKYRM